MMKFGKSVKELSDNYRALSSALGKFGIKIFPPKKTVTQELLEIAGCNATVAGAMVGLFAYCVKSGVKESEGRHLRTVIKQAYMKDSLEYQEWLVICDLCPVLAREYADYRGTSARDLAKNFRAGFADDASVLIEFLTEKGKNA